MAKEEVTSLEDHVPSGGVPESMTTPAVPEGHDDWLNEDIRTLVSDYEKKRSKKLDEDIDSLTMGYGATSMPPAEPLKLGDFLAIDVPEEHRLMANLVYNLAERVCHTLVGEKNAEVRQMCLEDLLALRRALMAA